MAKSTTPTTGTSAKDLLKVLQKDHGEAIGNLGGKLVDSTRIPSGLFAFDLATCGGLPRGRCSIIYGPESSGKCHAAGDRVIMFDGTLKNVENVMPGDQLMGVDSTQRTVTGVGKGYGQLYRITPIKGGDSFTVNAEHVLSLVCTHDQGNRRKGDIVNISVKDYLEKANDWKIYHHLYRVPVAFPEKDLPLDPYWLGLWLGDGASRAPVITTLDEEIVDWMQEYADCNGWQLRLYTAVGRCNSYATVGFANSRTSPRPAVPKDWLERLELIENKHIPHSYKTGSRDQRLRLLAGLLDSDGFRGTGSSMGFANTNCRLCEDLMFVARSLGLYASLSEKTTVCNGKECASFAVYLSGDFADVPLLLERKRPAPRTKAGSPLTSRFEVEPVHEGTYYGFELDGDHLYLLDSFIVNHNTNLVLLTIANHQRLWPDQTCIFFDLENSFDPEWAAKLGVKTEDLIVVKPEYAEKVVDMAESFLLADDCGVVAIDSLAALVTTSEGEASAERANVGGSGLVTGKLVRKTTLAMARAEKLGRSPTLIYINQTRFKIGVMFGDPETMPGGNAPKFQANLWIRLYGKNVTDPKVSKTMPVRKETTFIIKKNKVPILSAGGKFEMVTYPYQGLHPGDSVDWSLLKQYLTEYGCLEKGEKGGWEMLGEKYPTQEACKERIYSDKVFGMEVRQALIDRIVADGGALIEELS